MILLTIGGQKIEGIYYGGSKYMQCLVLHLSPSDKDSPQYSLLAPASLLGVVELLDALEDVPELLADGFEPVRDPDVGHVRPRHVVALDAVPSVVRPEPVLLHLGKQDRVLITPLASFELGTKKIQDDGEHDGANRLRSQSW